MTTERAIVKAILAYLNGQPGCLARKRWGGGMGVAGDPDIDACVRGCSVQLEVKRPGEKPTPLQLKRIEEWRRAGAVVAVVNSVADVRRLLQENRLLDRTTEVALANIVSEKSFVR
jgi:hypothetical protein